MEPHHGKGRSHHATGPFGVLVPWPSTFALASGADFYTASRIANYAAGVVVMKRGTATVTVKELKEVMEDLQG